jgi:outer membrane protein OmpA-like peptidoglycan-associated protein
MGYDELPVMINEAELKLVEGNIRRQWSQAPEGRSALEVIKNYENTIKNMGGEVLFLTRDPQSIIINEIYFEDYFERVRTNHGLSNANQLSHYHFPGEVSEYLAGKLSTSDKEIYTIIAVGKGQKALGLGDTIFYELITLEAEAMEMDMISIDSLEQGIEAAGRVAIYNIYFDTGEASIKEDSTEALTTTAEFLKENQDQRYLVVGHTDNTGDYMMNLDLSKARAEAVVEKLSNEYGISREQLRAVGVGPASPLFSNSTEDGRSKNRRVEIVEM